jgi:hypothetical protein
MEHNTNINRLKVVLHARSRNYGFTNFVHPLDTLEKKGKEIMIVGFKFRC